MSVECEEFDSIVRNEEPERVRALEAHAGHCERCAERLSLWNGISEAAPLLRRDAEGPDLWPRIRRTLEGESQRKTPFWRSPLHELRGSLRLAGWQPAAAAVLVIAVSAAVTLVVWRSSEPPIAGRPEAPAETKRLLTEAAVSEIERAEQSYVRSIERLSQLAESRIENATSPLLMSYREKLVVLDAAIEECRQQIESNRFNAHLRRELLSVYKEKQRTLEQLMQEERHAQN